MKRRTEEEALGIEERQALKAKAREDREKAIARAVADVLDGTCASADEAARGRGLSPNAVQAAVKAERARQKGGGA